MIVHNVGLNLLHFVFLLDVVVPLRLPRNDLLCFALHASRCVALRCVACQLAPAAESASQTLQRNQPATAMAAETTSQPATGSASQPASQSLRHNMVPGPPVS